MDFFTRNGLFDVKVTVKARKDVPFRGYNKLKFNIKPLFIPQNRQIWAQNTMDIFFAWKCLTMGALKSKLPLIIIVAP